MAYATFESRKINRLQHSCGLRRALKSTLVSKLTVRATALLFGSFPTDCHCSKLRTHKLGATRARANGLRGKNKENAPLQPLISHYLGDSNVARWKTRKIW